MHKPLKILDLFAGAGGLSLGFELARSKGKKIFKLHRAVEVDEHACLTLKKRYGTNKVIQGDLTKKEIHNSVIKQCKGKIDVVIGGIPCQSFSLIGPRSGFGKRMDKFKKDKRDLLYKEFYAIVKELKPKIIVIENVKGILSKKDLKGKRIIDRIIKDFEKAGYNFNIEKNNQKYMVLNAANYGVPQKRERVFIIGFYRRFTDSCMSAPKQTHSSEKTAKRLLKQVTIHEAIGDLPKVQAKITYTDIPLNQKKTIDRVNKHRNNGKDRINVNSKSYGNFLRTLSRSGKMFHQQIRPNGYKYIDHHVARSQQSSDIDLFKGMKQGWTAKDVIEKGSESLKIKIKYEMNAFKDKYRKQKWNEPCTTLFAHLQKDGNRFIHPKQARTITPREAARLQSFPDYIIFEGPPSKKFWQVGNAVPPLLAKAVAEAVFSSLNR